MGFCGDAVRVTSVELEALIELYEKQTQLIRLRAELADLSSGRSLAALQDEILALATEVSAQRSLVEESDREVARIASDLELVENRITRDSDRLQSSSNPKDITGIQHEMETLAKRKDELETQELELMETIDMEKSKLEQFLVRKETFESELAIAKESTRTEIDRRKAEILNFTNQIEKLRLQPSEELLTIYDQRVIRGVPVGKLLKSTCGACNMSLTSTALTNLQRIPDEQLARCPECTAILVR
jgi:predicted  nucleic acid-binding Zn-ribbon protein